MSRRLEVLLLVASLLLAGRVSAFTVQSSPCANRDDHYARPFVSYGLAVMEDLSREMNGRYGTVFSFLGANGRPEPGTPSADILAAAFESPELARGWTFCPQPLGLVHCALYARDDRVAEFLDSPVSAWPSNLRVAYSPFALGDVPDREDFFMRHGLKPEYVMNPASLGAVEDVRTNLCDVVFLYTVPGVRPAGLTEIAHVCERPWGLAVRRSRLWMCNELPRAFRRAYLSDLARFDELRFRHLGEVVPEKRVRVAAFRYGGLCERSVYGGYSGLLPEWLERVARLNRWSIDYVFGGFAEGVKDVIEGRLDMIGCVSTDFDRLESFSLPHQPIARIRLSLFAGKDTPYLPHAPETWSGMRIGCLAGTTSTRRMSEYLRRQRRDLVFIAYPSERMMLEAYGAGEIDALVHFRGAAHGGDKLLCSLPSQSIYFGIAKGRTDLVADFDRAMSVIDTETPRFHEDLQWRHLGAAPAASVAFTESESAALVHQAASGNPVRVLVSGESVATGPGGFLPAFLEELGAAMGIAFKPVVAADAVTARASFDAGEADFWIPYPLTLDSGIESRRLLEAVHVPQALVFRRGADPAQVQKGSLAVASDDLTRLNAYRAAGLSDWLVTCPNPIAAIQSGEANCTVMDYPAALAAVRASGGRLACLLRDRDPYIGRMPVLVSAKAQPFLGSALAKALLGFDPERMSELVRHADAGAPSHDIDWYRVWLWIRGYVGPLLALVLLVSILVIIRLVRAERVTRAALRTAEEASQAKTRFLSTMSHELRTPLNAVIGYADFLAAECDPNGPERIAESVRCIRSSGASLLALINDVLDLTKFDATRPSVREGSCDFRTLVREMRDIFSLRLAARNVAGRFECAPDLPPLRLSEARMRQVFVNLVGNAAKFTEAGSVSLSVSAAAAEGDRRTVTIEVADTGCGISPEMQASVFDPFVQDIPTRMNRCSTEGGTGLGLAIVKRIIDAAEGTVSLSSEPGRGSTFTIVLPDVEPAEAEAGPGEAPSAGGRLPRRVLVIDDVALNRRVLQLHLQSLGITDVLLVENGREGLEACSASSFDLVLTDLWMPEMDGSSFARTLRERLGPRTPPIVAITADIDCGQQFDMSVFSKVMAKPVTAEKIRLELQALGFSAGKETIR